MNKRRMLKKGLLTASSLAMVSAISIVGTMAYLTSSAENINVMTNGNVKIKQLEYERVLDKNGNWVSTNTTDEYGYNPDKLQKFTQAKAIYPAVYQDGDVKWDDRNGSQAASGDKSHQQSWAQVGAPGSNQLFDDSVKNVQDKFVFVKNTGKSDAYYRTLIAVECPEDIDASLIHINRTGNSRFDWKKVDTIKVNGVNYLLYEATYKEILKPGEVSRPSLLQVYLDPKATNEDIAAFGDTFEIFVTSQAVQTKGFDDAYTALDTAFGDITANNHPWNGDHNFMTQTVNTAVDMQKAVADGKEVIMTSDIKDSANESNGYGKTLIAQTNGGIINGAGNTLTATGANSTWDSTIYTKGGTIKNVNIRGGFRGIFIAYPKEDIVIDNVNIESVYTINADAGSNKSLTVTNSTLNGWTSYASTFSSVEFTDCSFGKGAGYAYFRPYANTTLNNCDFDLKAGYEIDTTKAKVTLNNCTVNGVAITAENISQLVNNTDNVTINN